MFLATYALMMQSNNDGATLETIIRLMSVEPNDKCLVAVLNAWFDNPTMSLPSSRHRDAVASWKWSSVVRLLGSGHKFYALMRSMVATYRHRICATLYAYQIVNTMGKGHPAANASTLSPYRRTLCIDLTGSSCLRQSK